MFTLIDKNERRVYKIRRSGKKVTVRYGRIGSPLKESTKSFPINPDAQAYALKLWNEHVDRGYYQVTAREWYKMAARAASVS